MVSETPTEGRCNAPAWLNFEEDDTKEGYCENYPKKDEDGLVINGRCNHHGAANTASHTGNAYADGGKPNNGNAEKHGLSSEGEKWFKRHRDDVEEQVKERVESWVENAPFGWDSGNIELLVHRAIKEEQLKQGDEYIEENGAIIQEKKVAGDGTFVTVDKENPAFKYQSRIHRTTLRMLKDMNILDSPEAEQAEADADKAKAWREALKGIGVDDPEGES